MNEKKNSEKNFISDKELKQYNHGTLYESYEKMGAHVTRQQDREGTNFTVWAPGAAEISVIGDWNEWKEGANLLEQRGDTGVWETFVPGIGKGALYKYGIRSRFHKAKGDKADPYAFATELTPQTASRIWDLSGYEWGDAAFLENRAKKNAFDSPMAIYELHLGSWKRPQDDKKRFLTYRELAAPLIEYLQYMGYTHVELMPVCEHPYYPSWGYQTVAYYAPTSRYGTPQDLMYLIDQLHQAGIGVILDWVPAHFPRDAHGLGFFDGTHLYEHADPRQGFHADWGTLIFNYGRPEVSNFLLSNALFWLDKYHIDGLRVDAVASMLYLDYSRKPGQWVANKFGGRENLDAIAFLRKLNELIYEKFPGAINIAEESTAWPMVSKPTYVGGLGFSYKWNMGWMHDILDYTKQDPIHRAYHHNKLTFGMMYAYSENYILPFSHDEVVHLKKSMLNKMPGDNWKKFANLRMLYGFMVGHPGKMLLFMGQDFGQQHEWNHDVELDWDLLEQTPHKQLQDWFRDLLHLYRTVPGLHQLDYDPNGFEWVDCNDSFRSVVSFLRWDRKREDATLFVMNFTPIPRIGYRVGVPWGGYWKEVLNSDATVYGGSGMGNYGGLEAEDISTHGRPDSLNLTLPPLSVLILQSTKPPEVAGTETGNGGTQDESS